MFIGPFILFNDFSCFACFGCYKVPGLSETTKKT